MTDSNHPLTSVYELVGQTLRDLGAHHQILIFRFGEYEIHADCFTRIVRDGKILLTSLDYQSWDGTDYTHNDMYSNIAAHGGDLIGQTVQSVEISPVHDLLITLSKDARIEILCSAGSRRFSDEAEQWFFYKPKDPEYPFLSVGREISEAIDRITRMERCFGALLEAPEENPELLDILKQYVDSGQWLRDYELDEQGSLPSDLKRGVLSQDALYDFLIDNQIDF